MSVVRSTHPDMIKSEVMRKCSFEAVVVFKDLIIAICDDWGVCKRSAINIKCECYPLYDNMTLDVIDNALQEMINLKILGELNNGEYIYIIHWFKYQNPRTYYENNPNPRPPIKTPKEYKDAHMLRIGNVYDTCRLRIGNVDDTYKQPIGDVKACNSISNSNKKKNINKKKKNTYPTLEEVKSYIQGKGYSVDAQYFFDYYETEKWASVRNWKLKLVTWENNSKKYNSKNKSYEKKIHPQQIEINEFSEV